MRLLRRYRVSTGMTIEQVAKKLRVSSGTVSNWETGTHGMRPSHLVRFAKMLGMHPIELSKMVEPDAPPMESHQLIASK